MIERYYVRPATVDRIQLSWISGAIEQYVTWLTEQKYSVRSVARRIPILVGFGEYARARGATAAAELPAHLDSFVAAWVEQRVKEPKSPQALKKVAQDVRNPIQQMLQLILPASAGAARASKPENPFARQVPDFFRYLREEKGLRETTLHHYSHFLRRLAAYLDAIGLTELTHLSPPVLSGFVTAISQDLNKTSVRDACGVLRVLLRYLYRQQLLPRDLSRVVEQPHTYRLSNVPRSISWDEVRRMLDAVDQRTKRGRRDYAILLLLVTYGLRAREVAALTLDDLDWKNERLKVPERKADHSTVYPLSPLVGQAILDYLKLARPQTAERHLFFRTMAPEAPLTFEGISAIASHYLHQAGIVVARPGSHTLRHTCVQRLVDAGLPLKDIGDYVGHRSPASTQIYGKVDVEALREVACGDGEEVL